jgi:hypothetical protein
MYYDRNMRNTVNDAYFRLKDERGRAFAYRDFGSDFDLGVSSISSFPSSERSLTQTHIIDRDKQTR